MYIVCVSRLSPAETLTPRYTWKVQADRAPGFADKALSERWRSAIGPHTGGERAQSHGTGETKPRSETSAVSDTERPDATAKAQLREEERKAKKSSKLWN